MPELFALVLLACAPSAVAKAEERAEAASTKFKAGVYHDAAVGRDLPYQLLSPRDYQPDAEPLYPLIVFLHGDAARGSDNAAQLRQCSVLGSAKRMNKNACFVLAPQCPKDLSWTSMSINVTPDRMAVETPVALNALFGLIEQVARDHKIDRNRVYLMGYSSGAFGVWEGAMRRPELFAALVPIAGAGDASPVKKIRKIPVWAFHGEKDTELSITRARTVVSALRSVDGDVEFTELEDKGHAILAKVLDDDELYKWLFEQKKLPATSAPASAPGK